MAAQWWDSAPKVDPFEAALSLEGLDPARAAIARSIYQQESGSGRNTATSNAGAVGGMQIIPPTFDRMADEGWNINDPLDNARAGVRYVSKLYDLADGDPRLTAAGYYGGEGAIPKARAGQAVSDPRNPNAPNTLQYADQVAARIPVQADDSWWQSAPLAEQPGEATTSRGPDGVMRVEMGGTVPSEPVSDSSLVALGAGLGSGVGQVALGAQEWLGRGMRGLGMERAGNWLVDDAQAGRKKLAGEVAPYKEVSPWAAGGGELAGNIAATWPVGGVLGRGVSAVAPSLGRLAPQAEKLANALRSGGMNLGGAPATTLAGQAGNLATRMIGGAGTGAVSAGLVDPESAGMGAAVGAAFPLAAVGLAKGGHAIGNMLRGGEVSAPVRDLANRAADLGIKVPADRIVNSRPMNAMAASLNYVPFSGRAAVEGTMQSQLNRALSRTVGQDSTNVTQALRSAAGDLGQKFDDVLQKTAVKVDDEFLGALAERAQQATNELGSDGARIIGKQIDEIINQAAKGNGQLEGQLAYNLKRTLDRIGQRSTPEAFYANELKRDLMSALNRSLGPKEAEAFAKVRQQYGNMLSLENLAKNGVDGDISIARLANMRNIRNPELQELADIAAQFLRPREGQHGAAQRIMAGALMGYGAGIPAVVASVGAGRMANSLLNSTAARNAMLGQQSNTALANALRQVLPVTAARSAPVIGAQ
ncbi:lytic transglycosylase domain-containing protein [Achromobacter aegrifaciens]|uniref:lytic transglycosylase domain-containing protein n=1 Tax=Achromobacter aegrifaciens TaxID=1287736 RepID=UPI0032079EBF